jgi:hypothetical protein
MGDYRSWPPFEVRATITTRRLRDRFAGPIVFLWPDGDSPARRPGSRPFRGQRWVNVALERRLFHVTLGGNINCGLFVHTDEEYEWLKSFMTKARMQELIGEDWRPEFWLERVELPGVKAVHFVWYGPLGRGTSSTSRLDNLGKRFASADVASTLNRISGKAFAEYIRSKHVEIPRKFLTA